MGQDHSNYLEMPGIVLNFFLLELSMEQETSNKSGNMVVFKDINHEESLLHNYHIAMHIVPRVLF